MITAFSIPPGYRKLAYFASPTVRLNSTSTSNGSARSGGSFSSNTAWRSTALVLLLLVCTTPGGMIAMEYFGGGKSGARR